MMETKILTSSRLVLFIICGLIIVIAVFLVGLYWGEIVNRDAYQQGYNTAWQRAVELVDGSGFFTPEPEEVLQLSGTILNINAQAKTLTFTAEPYSDNPLADIGPVTRTVKIDESTVIIKSTPKDFEEFIAEQERFDRIMAELGPEEEAPETPSAYTQEIISFEDLAQGDIIIVESLSDIKKAKQFTASQINVYARTEEASPTE